MLLLNLFSYSIFSLIFIFCIHYIYDYLKSNHTRKKIVYLGQLQNEKYQEILNELKTNDEKKNVEIENDEIVSYSENQNMQQSLLNYVLSS
jgi:hypothetical protein